MNEWLKDNLACPQDNQKVKLDENYLICPNNHRYPVVDGIPVMLFDDGNPTHGYITASLEKAARLEAGENLEDIIGRRENAPGEIDDFVQSEIPYTCGNLYFSIQNRLTRYPIPELRLPPGKGETLLDVGCNWGRWTIAAAQMNYQSIGIDPSLDAVLAARRIARQLGVEPQFVVGDARFLPFADEAFDVTFSFGVLQHFSKENAKRSLDEMARVLKDGGLTSVQMPNKFGIRSFYNQVRRGFSEGEGTDVRWWSPAELMKTFTEKFGKTKMTVDCYFGLGVQKNDADLLPLPFKIIVHSSEALRGLSNKLPFMMKVADSVYLDSVNQKNHKK